MDELFDQIEITDLQVNDIIEYHTELLLIEMTNQINKYNMATMVANEAIYALEALVPFMQDIVQYKQIFESRP